MWGEYNYGNSYNNYHHYYYPISQHATSLNKTIHSRVKLVCDIISVPLKNLNRYQISRWEVRLEGLVKTLQQQAKVLRRGKYTRICWNEKTKTKQHTSLTIQFEKMNKKILAKQGRLKRYWDCVKQCKQNRIFQNNKRKLYQKVGGESSRTNQWQDEKEAKQFWSQIRKQKEHNRKVEWINNMKKESQGLEKVSRG